MEAIILAGGKAERLGDAAGGRPKSLVEVAGRPLAAYQVGRLAQAGVDRVIISCAAGQGALFERELAGLGAGDRRGRGARAARPRRRDQVRGASCGSEARRRLRAERRRARRRRLRGPARHAPRAAARRDDHGRAAAVAVRRSSTSARTTSCAGSGGGARPVLGQLRHLRALGGGDRRASRSAATTSRPTFPELAAEGRLRAYRHDGLWLTVNTPKELRTAHEHVAAHPEWLA